MRFQRVLQLLLFLLFLFLLLLAAYPLSSWPVDLFLRLDPVVSIGSMWAARAFIPKVAWALAFLGAALLMGRVFCAYVCPMGAAIDFTDFLLKGEREQRLRRRRKEAVPPRHRGLKYLILFFMGGTVLVGISSVFLFAPLSLITRFFSFVVYPLALMLSNLLLDTFRPVFPMVGLERYSTLYLSVPTFDTNLFVAVLVAGILLAGLLQSRFWCRNLCPAGALFALFSRRPLFRRSVSDRCTQCGRCRRSCPMGAIGEDYVTTLHAECLTCFKCLEICPEKAISFEAKRGAAFSADLDLGRRKVLAAGLTGVATAAVTMSGMGHLHGGENPKAIRSSRLIRPPGALPEPAFQARCVRCGECMKACLTNTLQPTWFEAGLSGIWSPAMTARLAGCEQECNVCGQVCPTGAIRPLSMREKKFAKIGTARVIQSRCIAWEQNKRCLICDEICPYNAISCRFVPGHKVTVPIVDEERCNGCGYCEQKCPVTGEAAVVVEPSGELRLARGSYEEKARQLGLIFHAKKEIREDTILEGPPAEEAGPGEPEGPADGKEKLPPGFLLNE